MSDTDAVFDLLLNHPALRKTGRTLQRGDFLLRQGAIEKHLYLIHTGAVHAFYVGDDEEHTIRFGYSGSVIASLPSFCLQKPSELYFQALRKTELTAIERDSFFQAMETDDALKGLYLKTLELLAEQQMEREIDLLTSSPIERLERVRLRSPRVFQEIPLKYIASYLRMTPETLSRILNS